MKNLKDFKAATVVVVVFALLVIAPTRGVFTAGWVAFAITAFLWGLFLYIRFHDIRFALDRSITLRRMKRRNRALTASAVKKEVEFLRILACHGWFRQIDKRLSNPVTNVRVYVAISPGNLKSWGAQDFSRWVSLVLNDHSDLLPPYFILELEYGTVSTSCRAELQYHLVGHPGWQIEVAERTYWLVDNRGERIRIDQPQAFVGSDGTSIGWSFDWMTRALRFVELYDSVAHYAETYYRIWVANELGKTRRAFKSGEFKEIRETISKIDLELFRDTLAPDLSPVPAPATAQ